MLTTTASWCIVDVVKNYMCPAIRLGSNVRCAETMTRMYESTRRHKYYQGQRRRLCQRKFIHRHTRHGVGQESFSIPVRDANARLVIWEFGRTRPTIIVTVFRSFICGVVLVTVMLHDSQTSSPSLGLKSGEYPISQRDRRMAAGSGHEEQC
jgi:hypothetical protein